MSDKPKQPIVIVYGLSGTGKTDLVLSQPALFNRPSVAIHGHPKEYRDMPLARVFGYEKPPVASDPGVFRGILGNPDIGLLVIDEAGLAVSSFGEDFPLGVANSGKAGLILAQGVDEALRIVWLLTVRQDSPVISLNRNAMEIGKEGTKDSKEETGSGIEPILVPVVYADAVKALCRELLK